MIAAALEMTKRHQSPVRHEVQEAFLVHIRNLAEFFCRGVEESKHVPGQYVLRNEEWGDNIYAVDFCTEEAVRTRVNWVSKRLEPASRLRRAIDKTLSHMTYSRDLGGTQLVPFDGPSHVHGTVRLMHQTWCSFLESMHPELRDQLDQEVVIYEKAMGLGRAALSEFNAAAHARARCGEWRLNETPDGRVP